MSLEDILEKLRQAKSKPSEEDLRHLPVKKAFIYGRVSTDRQVEDSRESIREIAFQAGLAPRDGYSTNLITEEVERWLHDIQGGAERSRLLEDGDLIIDCQDLGLSGTLRWDKRPGLTHDAATPGGEDRGGISHRGDEPPVCRAAQGLATREGGLQVYRQPPGGRQLPQLLGVNREYEHSHVPSYVVTRMV